MTPLRRLLLTSLAGVSRRQMALTYDDGPDASPPKFLDLLDRHGHRDVVPARRTYRAAPRRGPRPARPGTSSAVHGWDHRCVAWTRPGHIDELHRTVDALTALTGTPVRWYRPPYGVLTAEALAAARSSG